LLPIIALPFTVGNDVSTKIVFVRSFLATANVVYKLNDFMERSSRKAALCITVKACHTAESECERKPARAEALAMFVVVAIVVATGGSLAATG